MPTIKKAVITAAGRGTRQFPATNTIQKELFPLVDVDGYTKPALQIIVEEALHGGVEEICIVANPQNADPIRRHFRGVEANETAFRGKDWALRQSDKLDEIGDRITIVIQETQEGYGHAVSMASTWVGDEPFVLMLGDHIYLSNRSQSCTAQVVAAYDRFRYPVSSVARTPESIVDRFGTIAGKRMHGDSRESSTSRPSYLITRLAEKPSADYARFHLRVPGVGPAEYLCFFGIHVFDRSLFEILDHLIAHDLRERGEIQLASAQAILQRTSTYIATEIDGERYDIGVPEGLLETQMALGLRSPFGVDIRRAFERQSDTTGSVTSSPSLRIGCYP